ncbi:3-oxoacyl-ACP synthase III family protein [Nocardiopsis quinghaiensis]|uniref:3-oxoacyl-ACP synthase III family protein n=1 Tax=Nocardiopsis quinghaiensis TaxID=464995 RepID=UPI001239917B|nr:beta-ketoacyl-ACP synthase 3 [Nocardiopsis quinghaiensis]
MSIAEPLHAPSPAFAPPDPALSHTVLGTGIGVPPTVVGNDALTAGLDTNDAWIRSRTGIRERRFLEPERTTSDLCVEAAQQALRSSGLTPADLDAVVVATMTPDQPIPSTALLVMDAIGAHRALPLDLNQGACAGGVLALHTGASLLRSPEIRHVLVIGADVMSRITDPADRTTRVFFGDAAGAVVLGRSDVPGYGILAWDFETALDHSVEIRAGGSALPASGDTVDRGEHYLRMDGKAVWKRATDMLPRSIRSAVARAGVDLDDVRHFVLHQANRNIVEHVLDTLGAERHRACVTVDWLGNTSAASVFTVLHEVVMAKKIQRDDVFVVSGIGAGFICGSLVIRYG